VTARRARPRSAVRLRRGRPSDAVAIARVMRAAVAGEAGRYPARDLAAWGSPPSLYHRWAMSVGGETYLVAVRGGRLLGYIAWRSSGRELTGLFVRPSAAGRGLGARLLAAAEARAAGAARDAAAARGRPVRTVTLRLLGARAVVPFYLAHGWRAVRKARSPLPDGRWLPAVWMEKTR